MTLANQEFDPIVEILRLAYRRGLAIQREKEEKRRAMNSPSLQDDKLLAEPESAQTVTQQDYSSK